MSATSRMAEEEDSSVEAPSERISPSFTQTLDVSSNNATYRADFDTENETAAFVSDNTGVSIQRLRSPLARRLSFSHQNYINSVAIKGGFVATSSGDGACNVESLDSSRRSFSRRCEDFPYAAHCDLSANGELLCVAFVNEESLASRVEIVKTEGCRLVSSWTLHDARIDFITLSGNGRFTFIMVINSWIMEEGVDTIRAFDTMSGMEHESLEITTLHSAGSLGLVSSDATGDNVVVMDVSSLRLWHLNDPDTPVYDLPGYKRPTKPSDERFVNLVMDVCAISNDGSRVVAAVEEDRFVVWETEERTQIATLVGHQGTPYGCRMSMDGESVFIATKTNSVYKWTLSTTSNEASELESALGAALWDVSVLTETFLLTHVRAGNVRTACDMLAGHNLVLLAMRTGVITRENMRTLGGSGWYLQYNLYLPASKLRKERGLIELIVHHAENLGIIAPGLSLKLAGLRLGAQKDVKSVSKAIEALAERIGILQANLVSRTGEEYLRTDLAALPLIRQPKIREGVLALATRLSELSEAIEQDRRAMYAALARCMLALVRLVSMSAGVAYGVVESVMNLKEEFICDAVDQGKFRIGDVGVVDLSNLQVTRVAFSDDLVGRMEHSARTAIRSAMSASAFGGGKDMAKVLGDVIAKVKREDTTAVSIDVGVGLMKRLAESGESSSASQEDR